MCIDVFPHVLVSVDEHGNEEAEEQDVKDVDEECDVGLTFWESELVEFLFTIEAIKDIKEYLKDRGLINLQLRSKLHTNDDEESNQQAKSSYELLELWHHVSDHHD